MLCGVMMNAHSRGKLKASSKIYSIMVILVNQVVWIYHMFLRSLNNILNPLCVLFVWKMLIKSATFSMNPYTAPRPYGFQPIFSQTYWDTIHDDVWKMVSMVFSTGFINPSLIDTFIVPIPKVDNTTCMRDFRPISLCKALLKIISKVLVLRIRPHLDTFIGPCQISFIPGGGMWYNALVEQEIVHSMHKKKGRSGYLMFKINFEKTYDRVDWDFLWLTLSEFGFSCTTIRVIMNCITSTSLAWRWNSEVQEGFKPSKGLRQGDHMSPYLFVLCTEKLALMIQELVTSKKWHPVKITKQIPTISHLFFAYDFLLFTMAKSSQGD